MRNPNFLLVLFSFSCLLATAQKKPLDHTVYDSWQSIGERAISNDGRWVLYSIAVQEGDNELVIQSADGRSKLSVPRGYSAVITDDSRFAIFRIKPVFKETREARIKKKKPDEMPKDSFAIVELGKDNVWKIPKVKTFKVPEKSAGWVAYHLEKAPDKRDTANRARRNEGGDRRVADSLSHIIDSLQTVISNKPNSKRKNKDEEITEDEYAQDADGDEPAGAAADAGSDLVVRNLENGKERTFNNVLEYYFSKKGGQLVMEMGKNPRDTSSRNSIVLFETASGNTKTLSRGGNDFKGFAFSEEGDQLAYLAERDAKPKELQKYYKLWYYKTGMDSSKLLVDKSSVGMKLGTTVSEFGNLNFSKSGQRLFFGTAPIQSPKDTTLVDFETAKLDIWNYKDDYLQTQQLFRLQRDLQNNYLAVYFLDKNTMKQLGCVDMPTVITTNEGDGNRFVVITDTGRRVESQWTGSTRKDIYALDPNTGDLKLIRKNMSGSISPQYISPSGKYVTWYEDKTRSYYSWDGDSTRNITSRIKVPLYDEENDVPADPNPYGLMGWSEGDSWLYVYDRYDIWKVDPSNRRAPVRLTPATSRTGKISFRYQRTDREERFIKEGQPMLFKITNDNDKTAAIYVSDKWPTNVKANSFAFQKASFGQVLRADNNPSAYYYAKESYTAAPDVYVSDGKSAMETKLSSINAQQQQYNWGTAELYKWKAFNGKMSEGVLYKPENFDATKKYPLILYFYETHSGTLFDYIDPSPTPSRLNIPFYVSRGYVVFSPDIHYTIGHPAKSCYDYVVSAAQDLGKQKWIDAKNIGIQGQSWGGIQVAQLITMTDMFKAAWAGAPVANMTSAYGGIRWESGVTRQFQYEKTQSRIGATLWEKPELYIENSPLFHLPKVKTPLVIMSNDADGAVPWYQGIELFTAMRRLGKKVWMLTYNGEAHNLVERRNRKDIQIREQQYFDWMLKGALPPKWITEGVPAVKKGKDWGLDLSEQ